MQNLDYSHKLDLSALETKGEVYDLKKIYTQLKEEYFDESLYLHLAWFGDKKEKNSQRVTFGLFQDSLRLIKINRILDHQSVPDYLIAYVVYHEMLHYICPTYVDANGSKHIHSKAFKEREQKFKFFKEARAWIQDYQRNF